MNSVSSMIWYNTINGMPGKYVLWSVSHPGDRVCERSLQSIPHWDSGRYLASCVSVLPFNTILMINSVSPSTVPSLSFYSAPMTFHLDFVLFWFSWNLFPFRYLFNHSVLSVIIILLSVLWPFSVVSDSASPRVLGKVTGHYTSMVASYALKTVCVCESENTCVVQIGFILRQDCQHTKGIAGSSLIDSASWEESKRCYSPPL